MGDWTAGSDASYTRPSDFMTRHLIAFARADAANSAKWLDIYPAVSAAGTTSSRTAAPPPA